MVNTSQSWRKFFLKGAQWSDLLKRLDWRVINEQTSRPFKILISNDLETELFRFNHPLRSRFESAFQQNEQRAFEQSSPFFCLSDDEAVFKQSFLFELTSREDISGRAWPVYVWPTNQASQKLLVKSILDQFSHYQEALAFHFPVFREVMIEREVLSTVRLNTAWVATSALPNIVPGPHQLLSVPIEAGSDFVVMTLNELRMMIRLTGLSGLVIRPAELFTQMVIVLSMAKIAQVTATQLASKIPGGVGVVVKGGIAYAFTRAMGEAIVLYLVTGRAQGKDFFHQRVDKWLRFYRNKKS